MRYLLIDCDPGHDDAMAILTACAHPEELKILDITTVGGNQTLKRVTENAKNILRFLREDIPLASGQEGPLVRRLQAAQIVFTSGIPIVMAGLDVTEKAAVTAEEIESLKTKGRISRMAGELLTFYHESGKQFGFVDSPIHDLCAVAYLLEPGMFRGERWHVEVSTEDGPARGLTYADKRLAGNEQKNVLVLEDVDRDRFAGLFIEALERLDASVCSR